MSDIRSYLEVSKPQFEEVKGRDSSSDYDIIAVSESILDNTDTLAEFENWINTDKREGCHVYPIKDAYGDFVYFDAPNDLVLCMVARYWG